MTPQHASDEQPNEFGRFSRLQYRTGSGEVPPELWSPNYQWLPSIVSLREGGKPKFTSYINNLDPNHYPEVYGTLESLVDTVIPAWDQCLQEREMRGRGGEQPGCGRAGRQDTRYERIQGGS